MHTAAQRQSSPCHRPTTRIPTICIVDPHATDHQRWHTAALEGAVRLQVFATAETALKYSRTHRIDLWVIKSELPGLSGFELCSMLKSPSARAPVWLVADEYSAAAERRAWASRATLFCCTATLDEHLAAAMSQLHDTVHQSTH